MITTVNPGSQLVLEGRFAVGVSLANVEVFGGDDDVCGAVIDLESLTPVPSLADLLRSFMYDPTETVVGAVRITIEPGRHDG